MCAPAWCRRLTGTLPEPEIYTRLARALGLLPGDNALAPLREAAQHSRVAFAQALRGFMGANPQAQPSARWCSIIRLARRCPTAPRPQRRSWQAAQSCAKRSPEAVRRALGADARRRIRRSAMPCSTRSWQRSGAAFTAHGYDEVWSLVSHPDRKVRLAIAPMLEWLAQLDAVQAQAPKDYPFVLAAGQRRMFNANQIFRDPAWRRDDPDGALLINAEDLEALGAHDGEWIAVASPAGRIVARCKTDDSLRPGQLALPHGYGQSYPAARWRAPEQRPADQRADRQRELRSGRAHALSQACRGAAGAARRTEAAACEERSRRIHAA